MGWNLFFIDLLGILSVHCDWWVPQQKTIFFNCIIKLRYFIQWEKILMLPCRVAFYLVMKELQGLIWINTFIEKNSCWIEKKNISRLTNVTSVYERLSVFLKKLVNVDEVYGDNMRNLETTTARIHDSPQCRAVHSVKAQSAHSSQEPSIIT